MEGKLLNSSQNLHVAVFTIEINLTTIVLIMFAADNVLALVNYLLCVIWLNWVQNF